MSDGPKIRNSVLVAGLERTGKTYFVQQVAGAYMKTGRAVLVYNVGNDVDFPDAEIIRPILPSDAHKYAKNQKERRALEDRFENDISLFIVERTGRVFEWKDFRRVFAGKSAKMYRQAGYDRQIATAVFKYVYDSMVLFDDNRAITRHGLSHNFVELLSRKNHAGTQYRGDLNPGVDLFFIYHNLDTVPRELWDYLTRVVMFKLNRMPEIEAGSDEIQEAVRASFNELKTAPRYSRIELIIRGEENIKRAKYFHNGG